MKAYWFEFTDEGCPYPMGISYGCGVTADSLIEAKALISSSIFDGRDLPTIENITENVSRRD